MAPLIDPVCRERGGKGGTHLFMWDICSRGNCLQVALRCSGCTDKIADVNGDKFNTSPTPGTSAASDTLLFAPFVNNALADKPTLKAGALESVGTGAAQVPALPASPSSIMQTHISETSEVSSAFFLCCLPPLRLGVGRALPPTPSPICRGAAIQLTRRIPAPAARE